MEACKIALKGSCWDLQLQNWKFFNQGSYEKVMNMQNHKIYNLEILGHPFESPKKCHNKNLKYATRRRMVTFS
jgi:hypothetical protein